MSVVSILGIVFIVLKLVGTIDWSWFLVLLPFMAPVFIYIMILILAMFGLVKVSKS